MKQQTFVCVHGVWHGGWCWSRLANILRARGHRVTTPTQTGLGERSHLLSPEISIQTFVEDIVRHLRFEEMTNVVLVGHSFGGIPITGVADLLPDRIAKLVYLDAIMLESGETWFDLLPEDLAGDRRKLAENSSGGLSLPPASPASFGITRPDDIAFLEPRLTPHPFRTFTTALDLKHPVGNGLPAHYIECTDPPYPPAKVALERAKAKGWPVSQIATGHDAMVSEPEALADLLEDIAEQP